jgi:RNA ligase (TIGR02306 family)
MSTHTVEVFEIKLLPHNNADSLSIIRFKNFQSVVRTEDWNDGDLAAFIPPDSIIPDYIAPYLKDRVIRAVRLRGEISEGLVIPAPIGSKVGDNVMKELGIEHYEPTPEGRGKEMSLNPPKIYTPVYDLENAKVYADSVFSVGDEIFITEKLHGENWRGLFIDDVLHVGSRTEWKDNIEYQSHWNSLDQNLELALRNNPGYMIIGESVGKVKGFNYGFSKEKTAVFVFDIYSTNEKRFLDFSEVRHFCYQNSINMVPVLYEGTYNGNIKYYFHYAEGVSYLGNHIKEGCVIRKQYVKSLPGHIVPALKIIGIDYLSKKNRRK